MNKTVLAPIGFLLLLLSCEKKEDNMDYKQEMRAFVTGISEYSKSIYPDFYVIPQNGIELVTTSGDEDGQPHSDYLNAIDGNGQEDLYYGYNKDDRATSAGTTSYLKTLLNVSKNSGNIILVTDYCTTPSKMDDSYNQNSINGFVSFSADQRELDNIPSYPNPIYSMNNNQITTLNQIQNFLYLINPENFGTKADFINSISSTNYDLLIMDLFFHDGTAFTSAEINELRIKANGGSRLVISYMSIGEAEDYRFYWQDDWKINIPSWMDKENPNWEGNFKVKYWIEDWQKIIYGNEDSYLDKILESNFDGVYLDIVDAFEYYE